MNSSFAVTKYPVMSRGTLEWEIENVGFHFCKCDECLAGTYHSRCAGGSQYMESPTLTLAATAGGSGEKSKWHFRFNKYIGSPFEFDLYFDGLVQEDGSELQTVEPFKFLYDATVQKKSSLGGTDTLFTTYGQSDGTTTLGRRIYFEELKSIWPDGGLKISVEISRVSDLVNQVVPKGPFLDFVNSKDSLSSCYGNLMNNPDLADFTITCEDFTFHAHKLILSVRSPVFRAMLESGMSESTQNKLEINDMNVETLKLMLEYIYKGKIQNFPEDLKLKIELLDSAEKYELKGLKSICMRKLFSNPPSEKDVGELAMAASIYGANSGAQKAIKDFCMTNHVKLMENQEYKKMFLANPQMFVN